MVSLCMSHELLVKLVFCTCASSMGASFCALRRYLEEHCGILAYVSGSSLRFYVRDGRDQGAGLP